MKPLPRAGLLLAGAILLQFSATTDACTACMGDTNSKTAEAMNGAIFLMLGCIGTMLGGIVAFAICLMRRANAPLSPDLDLITLATDED